MKSKNKIGMTNEEVRKRLQYCTENNLCFISLKPLQDERWITHSITGNEAIVVPVNGNFLK